MYLVLQLEKNTNVFLDFKLYGFFVFKVPESFSFIQTVDLYFKLHKVFNQSFEPTLVNMMTFVQYSVFSMKERGVNPTNRMNEVANMLK